MTLIHLLTLAFILFSIGVYGILTRRHLIGLLLSIEIILNAANINFLAFARFGSPDPVAGSIFSIFVIAVSAAEMAVALAIMMALYRKYRKLDTDALRELHD